MDIWTELSKQYEALGNDLKKSLNGKTASPPENEQVTGDPVQVSGESMIPESKIDDLIRKSLEKHMPQYARQTIPDTDYDEDDQELTEIRKSVRGMPDAVVPTITCERCSHENPITNIPATDVIKSFNDTIRDHTAVLLTALKKLDESKQRDEVIAKSLGVLGQFSDAIMKSMSGKFPSFQDGSPVKKQDNLIKGMLSGIMPNMDFLEGAQNEMAQETADLQELFEKLSIDDMQNCVKKALDNGECTSTDLAFVCSRPTQMDIIENESVVNALLKYGKGGK